MTYVNPIPKVDASVKAKISVTFNFEEFVTQEEAAEGINRLLEEHGGKIPVEWVKLIYAGDK
ncbi:hypothetical protein NIA71_08215 [Ihubacter massiliensis]|uniref:hypothetical protein n=1 Tax=Ihubacter massiliensis TaxID=1852367 RepID=UPI002097E1F6|nr:hypothetical protein [Ihubacter massiliensis]MCO7121934.1 hypothetical protein [Ihubacter massiliensis]